ncbi:MAG: hypothetical protein ACYCT2_09605 [Thermoplasmataceae archaeon]
MSWMQVAGMLEMWKHDLKLSDRIYHCEICGLTIDCDINTAIGLNIKIKGVEKPEKLTNVGRGTSEFTLVEIRTIAGRTN